MGSRHDLPLRCDRPPLGLAGRTDDAAKKCCQFFDDPRFVIYIDSGPPHQLFGRSRAGQKKVA